MCPHFATTGSPVSRSALALRQPHSPELPRVVELLNDVQRYLIVREQGLPPEQGTEEAWNAFYEFYSKKIRKYAFCCGATEKDIADCVQDVWAELLRRLPTFHLDPERGKFDTWLYHIVRGKAVDQLRSQKRRSSQENSHTLHTIVDAHASPARAVEEHEMFILAWHQLRKGLSECSFQVLQMRLVDQRTVAEVAEELGISNEQVWYRYHRARRQMEALGLAWSHLRVTPGPQNDPSHEKKVKRQEPAQGNTRSTVSRSVGTGFLAHQGGSCVDYVFQRLELGRRELTPEWKVEWNCDSIPKPVLYLRKSAIVAYAEICGPGDFISNHWPQIVNAAIAAGVAAGIATIIATPTAALPIFQTEFHKQWPGKAGSGPDGKIHVALSAKQEANGSWCVCKD